MIYRYPEDTTASIEDFRRSGWKAAVKSADRERYPSDWEALSDAARVALERGNAAEAKVLWLLADACSMNLRPDSANEPFRPIMIMEGKWTALPDIFKESEINLLAEIAEEVDEPWLRARLADLVWLLKRSPKHAVLAIDAYRAIPLDKKTWLRGGEECWERAICLTRLLGLGAGERIRQIEVAIITAFDEAKKEDGFFPLWLANLLFTYGLGKDRELNTADKLQLMARIFDDQGDLRLAREFFAASAKWYKRNGNEAKAAEMTVYVAEGWAKEAIGQISAKQPNLSAASCYENSIKIYRTIPRRQRPAFKADERIRELYGLMREAGEELSEVVGVVGVIRSPSIDISDMVASARVAVTGKTVPEALFALANVHPGSKEARLRQQAERSLREHPLLAAFPATHISRDGRVIAKRSGMGSGEEEDDIAVWAEMVKIFQIEVGLAVQGGIWPALEVVALEHRIREGDFVFLANQSPVVPAGRARLFGRALFAGYERDFVEALHLLVPQIEHMVRVHLKAAGVKTTKIDPNGIENENGLSALIEIAEVRQLCGEDITFEIKVLFCNRFGPNLRNQLAHGLLEEEECQSPYSIYAWWLGLKLVFNTFWNRLRKAGTKEGQSEEQENDQAR